MELRLFSKAIGKRRILGFDQMSNKRLNPQSREATNGPRARFRKKRVQFLIRRQ